MRERAEAQLIVSSQPVGDGMRVVCTCGAAGPRPAVSVARPAPQSEWTVSGPDGVAIVLTLSYRRAVELARLLAGFTCHGAWPSC
jgi:hypothetical protein